MNGERLFPIMTAGYGHEKRVSVLRAGGVCQMVVALPWAMIEPHEKQALRNHSQTLRRLAERGGLSACEALAILQDRDWKAIRDDVAHLNLSMLLAEFRARSVAA